MDKVARQMASEFDLECSWEGKHARLVRGGVDGHIALEKGQVHVYAPNSASSWA